MAESLSNTADTATNLPTTVECGVLEIAFVGPAIEGCGSGRGSKSCDCTEAHLAQRAKGTDSDKGYPSTLRAFS